MTTKKLTKEELLKLIQEVAEPILKQEGDPIKVKMNKMDDTKTSDGAAVKTKENGGFVVKKDAPENIPAEFEKKNDPVDEKMNKMDKDQGHDEKIAAAAKVEASGKEKGGEFTKGQKTANFTSKKENPSVNKENDPTQEGGKPGGKTNEPDMNKEDKAGPQGTKEVTKTMVTAGSEMNKNYSKGQHKAETHSEAKNDKETKEKIAKAIQLPEGFKNEKEMIDFVKKEALRISKIL